MLAGVALLIVFGSMATLAIWRASSDRHDHAAFEHRSRAVSSLQEARAQFYLSGALLTAAALSEEPLPFIASYRDAEQAGETSLQLAEDEFAAESDPQALSAVQGVDGRFKQLSPTLDALIAIALSSDAQTARNLAFEYFPKLWPSVGPILDDLGELVQVEQAKLANATADANRKANTSLWLLVSFGIAGFLIALAMLANLIQSVVRPLASLQRSVRAVTSGDMESRAEVFGPQEVASLATDFNEMVSRLNDGAALMRHRLDVESAVGRTSALLDTAEDADRGLNSALQILAKAVDAEHAYIFMFKDGNTKMDNTHEWNAAGMIAAKDRFSDLDCATYGWWVGKLLHNEEVVVHDLSQLPPEAAAERAILEKMRAKCALAVPFGPSGKPAGFIGFGDTRRESLVARRGHSSAPPGFRDHLLIHQPSQCSAGAAPERGAFPFVERCRAHRHLPDRRYGRNRLLQRPPERDGRQVLRSGTLVGRGHSSR